MPVNQSSPPLHNTMQYFLSISFLLSQARLLSKQSSCLIGTTSNSSSSKCVGTFYSSTTTRTVMHSNELIQNRQSPEPPAQDRLLLEDWPNRSSPSTEADHGEANDNQDSKPLNSRVNFLEHSMLHLYERDDEYLKNLAYTKDDRDEFSAQATLEASRIKDLITTAPPDSVKDSIKYLFQNGIITRDELVGIDHLILGKGKKIVQKRREHSAAVLWKQYQQKQEQQFKQESEADQSTIVLGRFAEQSSLKSTRSAIARATLSCSSPQTSTSIAKAA